MELLPENKSESASRSSTPPPPRDGSNNDDDDNDNNGNNDDGSSPSSGGGSQHQQPPSSSGDQDPSSSGDSSSHNNENSSSSTSSNQPPKDSSLAPGSGGITVREYSDPSQIAAGWSNPESSSLLTRYAKYLTNSNTAAADVNPPLHDVTTAICDPLPPSPSSSTEQQQQQTLQSSENILETFVHNPPNVSAASTSSADEKDTHNYPNAQSPSDHQPQKPSTEELDTPSTNVVATADDSSASLPQNNNNVNVLDNQKIPYPSVDVATSAITSTPTSSHHALSPDGLPSTSQEKETTQVISTLSFPQVDTEVQEYSDSTSSTPFRVSPDPHRPQQQHQQHQQNLSLNKDGAVTTVDKLAGTRRERSHENYNFDDFTVQESSFARQFPVAPKMRSLSPEPSRPAARQNSSGDESAAPQDLNTATSPRPHSVVAASAGKPSDSCERRSQAAESPSRDSTSLDDNPASSAVRCSHDRLSSSSLLNHQQANAPLHPHQVPSSSAAVPAKDHPASVEPAPRPDARCDLLSNNHNSDSSSLNLNSAHHHLHQQREVEKSESLDDVGQGETSAVSGPSTAAGASSSSSPPPVRAGTRFKKKISHRSCLSLGFGPGAVERKFHSEAQRRGFAPVVSATCCDASPVSAGRSRRTTSKQNASNKTLLKNLSKKSKHSHRKSLAPNIFYFSGQAKNTIFNSRRRLCPNSYSQSNKAATS